MNIVTILIWTLIIGFICWGITAIPIPIHPWFKHVIIGIILIVFLIYLLGQFGINTGFNLKLR